MTRALTAGMEAALAAPVIRPFLAVELLFDSGATRANTTPIDITIDGAVYRGVGDLGRIATIVENGETAAQSLGLDLSGIPAAALSLALGEHYQGRRGTVWYGCLDADHAVIADPLILFRGRIDTMVPTLGESGTIRVTLASRTADWERPRGGRYTDEEQKRRWPDDKGLEFVARTVEQELVWGTGGTTQPVVVQTAGGGGKK